MHTVHYRVSSGYQVGRTLCKPGKKIKGFFPTPAGSVHLMRGITVKEKSVEEQRKKPMQKEE